MQHKPLDHFHVLFAHLWHRDFPVDPVYRQATNGRTDWTIHIGSVVRACAILEGWGTEFEGNNRTDGRILRPVGEGKQEAVVALEWEWEPLHTHPKEIASLNKADLPADGFACFIGYSLTYNLVADVQWCADQWTSEQPLLAIVITYEGQTRYFHQMHFYKIVKGMTPKLLWSQMALPWEVPGTRWYVRGEK